jgi:hypothetical protein
MPLLFTIVKHSVNRLRHSVPSNTATCHVITLVTFTATHTASNLILSILENKTVLQGQTKVQKNTKLNMFQFIPDNLLCELSSISFFLFMFTTTKFSMLPLLHTSLLPLSITNITSCQSRFNNSQNFNGLITGMVASNIFWTSVRAGATVLKEMAIETITPAAANCPLLVVKQMN